jgi:hypothetical protein
VRHQAAAASCGSLREITRLIPSSPMETP